MELKLKLGSHLHGPMLMWIWSRSRSRIRMRVWLLLLLLSTFCRSGCFCLWSCEILMVRFSFAALQRYYQLVVFMSALFWSGAHFALNLIMSRLELQETPLPL